MIDHTMTLIRYFISQSGSKRQSCRELTSALARLSCILRFDVLFAATSELNLAHSRL